MARASITTSALLLITGVARAATVSLDEGATFQLGPRSATLRTFRSLPFVESEYSRRFRFDTWDNPKLRELRERHQLDRVVAAGRDGYATLGPVYAAGRYVNTYLLYTQTFVDYLTATGPLARPSRADYSHQTVITRDGRALP